MTLEQTSNRLPECRAPHRARGLLRGLFPSTAITLSLVMLLAHPTPTSAHEGPHKHRTRAAPSIGAPFELRTPEQQPLTHETFRGNWLIVFFGYTFCPDVCPTTLTMLTETFALLGTEGESVRGLFITLDPRRDTPALLKQYMANFSPRITAATGTDAQIAAAVKVFRVRYEIEGDLASNRYTISHPVAMMLFDPHGQFISLIPGSASAREVSRSLRDLMKRNR